MSEFPNLDERLPRRDASPAPIGGGLPRHRYAEAFERLRVRSEAHAVRTGQRPTVLLATLGPSAVHSGRSSFAANLFYAGGIATVIADGDPAVAAESLAASGATVACLCSSDRVYAEGAAPAARALAAAGALRVWLAGSPGGYDGVDGYLYAGCDAVAVLESTLADLGVA